MPGYVIKTFLEKKMATLFANSGDPDQAPHSVASDPALLCLPITLLGGFTNLNMLSVFAMLLHKKFELIIFKKKINYTML